MTVSKVLRTALQQLVMFVVYAGIGLLAGILYLLYGYADGLPPLERWHRVQLSPALSATQPVETLPQYLAAEARLFDELKQRIYADTETQASFSRYKAGGQLDPTHYTDNWNRSHYLRSDQPKAGVLLLHGLSDSPYSLRSLATTLHHRQADVLALRLPGHGTIPSGLLTVSAEDFRRAVRLGARELRKNLPPGAPLYIVGYSNGATLALDYALSRIEGEQLPEVTALILLSPAISVSELARLAPWQRRLSHLPGLEKLAWHSIQPEYDPYKYNSFTLNAADQIYHLTSNLHQRLQRLQADEQLQDFPPVLCFVSAVDATVSVQAVVEQLLMRLPDNHHRLVVYDINREEYSTFLFSHSPGSLAEQLLARPLPFALTLLTNTNERSSTLNILHKAAGEDAVERETTALRWPPGIFSLSHVALPFAPSDPVYGDGKLGQYRHQSLGNIRLRGERGVLRIPDGQLIRLRYNPFYDWQQHLILKALQLQPDDPS